MFMHGRGVDVELAVGFDRAGTMAWDRWGIEMVRRAPLRVLLSGTAGWLLVGLHPAQAAEAPDQLAEVVVTATKTGATKLQQTPIAMSAITTAQIDQTGLHDVRDLATMTPNLVIAENSGLAQIYIRGIGSNNVFAGSDPSSTLQIDGVYIARPAAVFYDFLDVDRIEVLRGPQGTLYGRNSVGGTINIISRLPTNTFESKAEATYGNFNAYGGEAYVSGPLIKDRLMASLSLNGSQHDGYFKNIVPGSNDYGADRSWGIRGQLRATPTDALEIIVRADYAAASGALATNQVPLQPFDAVTDKVLNDAHKVALDTPGSSNRSVDGVSAEINYTVSPALVFKSLTAYRDSKFIGKLDADATDQHLNETDLDERQHQFSEELNLSGHAAGFHYVFGLYYIDEHIHLDTTAFNFLAGIAPRITPVVKTRAYAVYGQASYDVTSQLTLTAGVRYTKETKDFDEDFNITPVGMTMSVPGFPVIYSRVGNYDAVTPKFGIEYRPVQDVMFYASVTRGFKSGGFNFASLNPTQGYNPEYLWSYEGGVKSEFFDHRLRLNADGFYYDYTDLQVQAFIAPGVVDITNAANATVKGVELEALARPATGLEVGASATWLDATYKTFPAAPVGLTTVNASGNFLNTAPEWAYNVFADYTVPVATGHGFARIEYSWKSRQFFTPANDDIETQGAYGLLNASIGWRSPGDHWQVIVFGRNLTDQGYLVSTGSYTAVPAGTPGDPRTFGIRFIAQY